MQSALEQKHDQKAVELVASDERLQNFVRQECAGDAFGLQKVPSVTFNKQVRMWMPDSMEKQVRETIATKKPGLTENDLEPIYAGAMELEQRLSDALNAYKSTTSNNGEAKQVQVDGKETTWETLDRFVIEIEQKKLAYSSKNEQWLDKARKAFREFSNHAASVKCFTALLPTQSNYGSVLFGGSVILLEAAHQLSVERRDIIEALESIPRTLSEMTETVELYPNDIGVHRACAHLYSAVLKAYLFIVDWFHRSAPKKFWNAFKHQKSHTENGIKELLRQVRMQKEEFQSRANMVGRADQRETNELVQRLFADAGATEEKAMEALDKVTNMLAGRLIDCMREALPRRRPRRKQLLPKKITVSAKQILQHLEQLGLDVTTARKDYFQILDSASPMKMKESRKVADTLVHSRMIDWFRGIETNVLLVNGHSEASPHSPSTMLATKVLEALELSSGSATDPVFVLYWYCSRHFIYDEDDAHPQGMALHLLAQLVATLPSMESENVVPAWQAFNPQTVESIFDVLEKIVADLPSEARIFIVLEAVCKYEGSGRRADLLKLVERLGRLAYAEDGPLVKVLMTSVQSTNHVYEMLDAEQDVIDMY